MADLILINGAPGSGKSTLARLLAEDRPLRLALDVDTIKHALGQWQGSMPASGLAARQLATSIAATHLRAGHDVVVSQYLARPEFIEELAALAADVPARFVEVILHVEERALRDRLASRASEPSRPEHRVNAQLVGPDDAAGLVDSMRYLARARPSAVVVDADGRLDRTLELLRAAVTDDQVTTAVTTTLAASWSAQPGSIQPLTGGMNSRTWRLRVNGHPAVAKWVPAEGVDGLLSGIAAVQALSAAPVRLPRPVRTATGAEWIECAGGALTVMEWVAGRPATAADQGLIGTTLAAVHRAGAAPADGPAEPFFDWLAEAAERGFGTTWVQPAVRQVLGEFAALPPLTPGIVHTDPAPEAFLVPAEGTGEPIGLIDWAGATRGPLLYDVASAVMYLGGPDRAGPFLTAYLADPPLPGTEVADHLEVLVRYRWAVQAAYFAVRLDRDDRTGIADWEGNVEGLEAARENLHALGVRPPSSRG